MTVKNGRRFGTAHLPLGTTSFSPLMIYFQQFNDATIVKQLSNDFNLTIYFNLSC